MTSHRLERVANLVREMISTMIIRNEIKDPRVTSMLSLTEIKIAKDLSSAKIGVAGYMPPHRLDKAAEGLNHAAKFIQGRLGKNLHIRTVPRLIFYPDHAIKEGFEMTKKIDELFPGKPEEGNQETGE
jgi:ribosome-binding factor A